MINVIIDELGAAYIADRMNTTAQRVSNWKTRGLPLESTIDFCKAVDWKITPHELYPKNYPNPQDGLPASMREAA